MERRKEMNIVFFGRESGLILKEKLELAGFHIVSPESSDIDLIVVGFYGKILQKKILEVPKYGALNVHPSLLPKYRGPTPIQSTILNGETRTGVTIIAMDEKVDHGSILATADFDIGDKRYTTPELTKELWELGGDLLIKIIPQWVAKTITPVPQDHSKATFTRLLTKEDGKIDWNNSALYIERQVRAYTPWPGAFTSLKGKLLKIHKARVISNQGTPGQTFLTESKEPGVYTGSQSLVLEEIQLEGKKNTSGKDFLLGHKDFISQSLL